MFSFLKELLRGPIAVQDRKREEERQSQALAEQNQAKRAQSLHFDKNPLRMTTQGRGNFRGITFPRRYDGAYEDLQAPRREDEGLVAGQQGYAPAFTDIASFRRPNIVSLSDFKAPVRNHSISLQSSDPYNRLRVR